MNTSDSERIAAVLESIGYRAAAKMETADLVVVNACSVRQSAIDRIHGLALKFKGKKFKTVLTGCVLDEDKKKLLAGFDLFLNIEDLLYLPEILGRRSAVPEKHYLRSKPKYSSDFSASIPIMTGCNNFCSYCVVPYTRGPEVSRPAEDILTEAKELIKTGCKELWLLGQNVNSYRSADKINFAQLLEMINSISGKFWIRFTSPHPKDFSVEMIKAITELKKVTPYFNLPVQSGDNAVLKRMNRPYTVEKYKKLVEDIRRAKKDIAISTDVIVGFPGETNKQFLNTCQLFKDVEFDMAYINRYSPRSQTAAAKMKDNVPALEKKQRENVLNEILKVTALEKNKQFINKKVAVLAQSSSGKFLTGKTEHFKTIKFEGPKSLKGKFVKVKVLAASSWGLKGEI